MIDKITSLFDNYSEKIKNPFFGTIISVWLIHNWRIPYALFNFDKECSMQDKINFIADYFGKQNFWLELLNIIGYSFLVLIFSFVLMAISRALTDFYYKIVEPFIKTKIDKKEILTLATKNSLDNKIKELEDNLNGKREEITRTESNSQAITRNRDLIQSEFQEFQRQTDITIKKLTEDLNVYTRTKEATDNIREMYLKVIESFDDLERSQISKIIKNSSFATHLKSNPSLSSKFEEYGFLRRYNDQLIETVSWKLFSDFYSANELPF